MTELEANSSCNACWLRVSRWAWIVGAPSQENGVGLDLPLLVGDLAAHAQGELFEDGDGVRLLFDRSLQVGERND